MTEGSDRAEVVAYAYEVRAGDHLSTDMDEPTPVTGVTIVGDQVTVQFEGHDPVVFERATVLDVHRTVADMIGYFPIQVLP